MTVTTGDQAPDIVLPTDGGGEMKLSDLKGRRVVVFFYPKDNTPGCTTEAQAFRDRYGEITALNAEVVGVSKDGVKSHDNFKAKHDLPYPLISDKDIQLIEAFGAWKEKKNYGRTYMGVERSTFLLDENGVIRREWRGVKVKGHAEEVLDALKGL